MTQSPQQQPKQPDEQKAPFFDWQKMVEEYTAIQREMEVEAGKAGRVATWMKLISRGTQLMEQAYEAGYRFEYVEGGEKGEFTFTLLPMTPEEQDEYERQYWQQDHHRYGTSYLTEARIREYIGKAFQEIMTPSHKIEIDEVTYLKDVSTYAVHVWSVSLTSTITFHDGSTSMAHINRIVYQQGERYESFHLAEHARMRVRPLISPLLPPLPSEKDREGGEESPI